MNDDDGPKWEPIGKIERRVLGVLGEKAKTTPDALFPKSQVCRRQRKKTPFPQRL